MRINGTTMASARPMSASKSSKIPKPVPREKGEIAFAVAADFYTHAHAFQAGMCALLKQAIPDPLPVSQIVFQSERMSAFGRPLACAVYG